ncbi:MAG: RNA polymerase sigma factor [Bacillota bacterium]
MILAAQQGDDEPFSKLVRENESFLLSLAASYVGKQDAADVAQEIWLAVHRKLWQLEQPTAFRSWLRQVVFYQCLNHRKARARRWKG